MPIGGVNNPCTSCEGTGLDEGEFCVQCLGTGYTTDTGTKLFLKGVLEKVDAMVAVQAEHTTALSDIEDTCDDIKEKVDEIKEAVDEL